METALKQRVVGAIVLVALAVIFLPMLIKGPAPESGISDVPLDLPDAPEGDFETRELPLVTPGPAPATGIVGMDATATDRDASGSMASPDAASGATSGSGMLHAATAGGDYAVSFGRYATAADAAKVVAALQGSQLPGYAEAVDENARTLHRVRIGPFATRAEAESARLRATHVNDQVDANVVVLDATVAEPSTTTTTTNGPAAAPIASGTIATETAEAKPALARPTAPETKPAAASPKPTAVTPAAPAPAKPATSSTAAAGTGFAVQLGAFSNAAEAERLRDRARAAGLRAFVESVRTDKGVLSRVRVGPVLTRADADQLKAQVASKLGIGDAIVKPHP